MFNIGFFELLIVAAAGLLILGPERFPQAARALARFIYELKRAFFDAKSQFDGMQGGGINIKKESQKLLKEAEQFLSSPSGSPGPASPQAAKSGPKGSLLKNTPLKEGEVSGQSAAKQPQKAMPQKTKGEKV